MVADGFKVEILSLLLVTFSDVATGVDDTGCRVVVIVPFVTKAVWG